MKYVTSLPFWVSRSARLEKSVLVLNYRVENPVGLVVLEQAFEDDIEEGRGRHRSWRRAPSLLSLEQGRDNGSERDPP